MALYQFSASPISKFYKLRFAKKNSFKIIFFWPSKISHELGSPLLVGHSKFVVLALTFLLVFKKA